jgi:IS605 OrfB family transposase
MAFRYRLRPDGSQVTGCERHCGDARYVWNLALEQANCWRPGRKATPGRVERDRQLAEARRETWLGSGSSSVQQQALRDFDQAIRNWWAGTHRRPRWRKAGLDEGFCIRDVKVRRISRKWAEVWVPKVGWVRFRLTRPLGEHGMARVTKDRAGRWHVSFSAPQPAVDRTSRGAAVGVDVGVAHTITTSAGVHLDIPSLRPGEQARLLHLERRKTRQQKGSNRCARTKHAIAALHSRATDRRHDWAEQTSTSLVTDHDLVVSEDLRVKDMLRSARGTVGSPGRNIRAKAGLNRRIAASAWSTLVRRTRQKAEASEGCEVVLVDPRYTSQRCSACGHVDRGNRPSQAMFRWLVCGHAEHADVNAAKNILAAGLAATARGGKPEVRAPGEARTTPLEAA